MHTDPELLALLALGEQAGTDEERHHVEGCAVCTAEVDELREVAVLARSAGGLRISDPDPRVWTAVRDEIRAGAAAARAAAAQEPRVHARLAPVEDVWSLASGEAELATDERGRRLLRVTLHADLPADGVRQAWLVHRDDPRRRQTLGILDGPHGLWTVEHAIDLDEFGILDISQQELGSTEHSGRSIVRGELVPAA
jgi:hypothetical protein